MQKSLMKFEISGIFFVLIMSVFLQNLYTLSDKQLIGVMFGSVNDSIWETTKTLLLPFILWSIFEIMCTRLPFRKFVTAKVISLYYLGLCYILLCLIVSLTDSSSRYLLEFASAIIAVCTALFLSYRLVFSGFELQKYFAPSFFMLLLFVALFCSFTPFPPKMYIFMDRTTNLYGIIPEHIDQGAIVLDAMYLF